MKLIEPMLITDTEFVSSNVAEDDYAEWNVASTYAASDYVIVIGSTHKIYQSVLSANVGNNPVTDDGTNWLVISATCRWKAFDLVLADKAVNSGSLTYKLVPSEMITGMAFFGIVGVTVQVQVTDLTPAVIYDVTVDLTDTTEVIDWFPFFFEPVVFDTESMFIEVPGYADWTIDITISVTSGNAQVGQIVLGQTRNLGDSLSGTSIGIQDFSTKSRDAFGNATIIERAFIDEAVFNFALNTADARRIKRILTRLRAKPAVYFADENLIRHGATVYGFYRDFSIPLTAGQISFATLEIEGLT